MRTIRRNIIIGITILGILSIANTTIARFTIDSSRPLKEETGQMTFIENFDGKSGYNWKEWNEDWGKADIDNGVYILEYKKENGGMVAWFPEELQIDLQKNFEIFISIKAKPTEVVGLIWGAKDMENHHQIILYSRHWWYAEKKDNNMKNKVEGSLMNSYSDSRSIKLRKEGQNISVHFDVEWHQLGKIKHFSGNKIGFFIQNEMEARIESVYVKYVPSQKTVEMLPTATPGLLPSSSTDDTRQDISNNDGGTSDVPKKETETQEQNFRFLNELYKQGKITPEHFECALDMLDSGITNRYLNDLLTGVLSPKTFSRFFQCSPQE